MKIKVIGWTYYEDIDYPDGEITNAKHNVVIDEIRKHQYLFSGHSHQELHNTVPVFNDGTKGTWSQRGWGAIMAEAYNEEGLYAYSVYAFGLRNEKIPTGSVDDSLIVSDVTSLHEDFIVEVHNEDDFNIFSNSNKIKLPKIDDYRYMSIGDTIIFNYENRQIKRVIKDMETDYDFKDKEERLKLLYAHGDEIKDAEEKLKLIPIIYRITF